MYKKLLPILVIAVSATLFGCAGVQYKDAPLAVELDYTPEIQRDYYADAEWWRAYNDPELNRLVEMALVNNTDLAQSALTMRKAMYQAQLSELDLFPTLVGSAGASANRAVYMHDNFSKTFSGELSLSYEVDLWGKIRDLAEASDWEFYATAQDLETVRLALINSVVDVYYNLAYLYGAVKATRENLDNYRQIETIIDTKFASGKTDALESLQIQQTIISYQNNLLNYETQIKDNEQVLRNLLNLRPADLLMVNYSDMLEVKPLTVDLDVPLAVLAERPDLKASEARLRRAFKNLEAQEKSWYPTISLRTALSSQADKIGDTFDFPFLMGSLSISLPFLSWNTVQTNINISETDYEIARLTFESDINTALNEVAYYYFAYENTKFIFDNAVAKHEADRKIMALYEVRYRSGKAEFKDLLDSINTFNSSRLDMLSDNYQLIKYENMVFKAMAGRYQALRQVTY